MKARRIIPLLALSAVLVLVVLAAGRRPDRNAHRDAITDVLLEEMVDGVEVKEENRERFDRIVSGFGRRMTGRLVGRGLVVRNHLLWSTGELTFVEGPDRTVSYGVLGHVFVKKRKVVEASFKNGADSLSVMSFSD